MTRKIKQLIFAAAFFAVFLLIFFGIFFLVYILPQIIESRYQVEEPEEYVFTPVSVRGDVRFSSLGGKKASVMAELVNREPDYHADVLYEVIFFDPNDGIVDIKKGRAFIFSNGSFWVHEGVGVFEGGVARAELEIFETVWIEDKKGPKPPPPEVASFRIEETEEFLIVEGTVENPDLFKWEEIKIIAVFVDDIGFPVFSAHIVLNHMNVLEARDFRIPISEPEKLYGKIVPEKTKMFVSAYGAY